MLKSKKIKLNNKKKIKHNKRNVSKLIKNLVLKTKRTSKSNWQKRKNIKRKLKSSKIKFKRQ